jgi:CheY-like chemotaxis protein
MGSDVSQGAGPLVLYVEDDPLIVDLGLAVLEEGGFNVAAVRSAVEAIKALDERGGDFKALITDVDLGSELSGWDVARHAREMFPDLPVIYVSGGSSNEWASMGVPGSIMLVKPYAATQLLVALSTAMLGPSGLTSPST